MKTSLQPRAPSWMGRVSLLAAVLLLPLLLVAPSGAEVGVTREPFCYSWDFMNSTGQDADDLHVALAGIRQVTSVYEGDGNVFGAPLPASGYDPGIDAYQLEYGGGPALDATPNQIGVCAGSAVLRLASARAEMPFYWTAAGEPVGPAPVFLGLSWARLASGGLRVSVYNDQASALTIWSASLLAAAEPLPLADLNAGALASLPGLAELPEDVVVLKPAGVLSFDIPRAALAALPAGGALLFSAEFSNEADDGDLGHLYAQLLMPGATYLPLIQR